MIPLDRSFVLLDASLTSEQALVRMATFKRARWAVVRRVEGVLVYWYSFDADEARHLFTTAKPGTPVRVALDLHEYQAKPTYDAGAPAVPPSRGDILLTRGHLLAGVASGPIPMAGPPAAAAPKTAPAPASGNRLKPPAPPPPAPARRRGIAPAAPAPAPRRGTRAKPPDAEPPKGIPRAPIVGGAEGGGGFGAGRGAGAGADDTMVFHRPPIGGATGAARRGAHAAPGPMPPFSAWPDLGAPLAVEAGRAFDVTIGFAVQPVAGVAGGPVVIEAAPPDFDLDVQVLAVGFDAPKGLHHTLRVHRDDPTQGKITVPLVARALDAGVATAQRVLSVSYAYLGNVCGIATRNLLIARAGAVPNNTQLADPRSFVAQAPAAPPLHVRPDVPAPDLTVTLMRYDGNPADGNFVWGFRSPHDITLPQPVAKHLGTDAASYARGITTEIVELGDAGSAGVKAHLKGSGRDISDHVPKELWDAIASVLPHATPEGAPPDVFFVTEESCVPWELAWMPAPLDPKRPAFLGAQVNLGRWIVGDPEPGAPPDPAVSVKQMVVMYGDYADVRDRLPEAIQEKDALVKAYHAAPLTMADADVAHVLDGEQPKGGCELLHFACHGAGDPQHPGLTRLKLQSGAPFTDNAFRGGELGEKNHPFVFMNACEAGTAGDELDTTSGFVEATLKSGCSAFVGALWEVASTTARDIAIEFYQLTLDDGLSVAAAMREIRCKFDLSKDVPDDTYLAYVFYGHPGLKLTRKK